MSFGGAPSYTPPAVVPAGLTPEEIAAQKAAKAAEKARTKARRGFASTLLAGETAGTGSGQTQKATLLGGG